MIFTVSKLIHPSNVKLLITATPEGTVTDVNDSQPLNTPNPIDVTEYGIVMDERLEQLEKAYLPNDVGFDATLTVSNLLKPLNAYSPIEDTPPWMTMFFTCSVRCDHGV